MRIIGKKCGLDKALNFHITRHTFSTLCLSKGMDIETLSRILGHQSIRTTQIYAKITKSKIAGNMKNVALQLEGKEGEYTMNDVAQLNAAFWVWELVLGIAPDLFSGHRP